MRIEVDDRLIRAAMKGCGISNKKLVVENALKLLMRVQAQTRSADLEEKYSGKAISKRVARVDFEQIPGSRALTRSVLPISKWLGLTRFSAHSSARLWLRVVLERSPR